MTETPDIALTALRDDPNLKRLEDLLREFNLFEVLQIGQMELQHSWLIAWLLNPRGSHGLSDAFLRTFIAQATAVAEERGISVPSPSDGASWRFTDIEIARERHNIDVLVISREDQLACLIENKIYSSEITGDEEKSGQLRRYLDTIRRSYPTLKRFPIFLTPDGRKPFKEQDQDDYVPLGYGQVANIIDKMLQTHAALLTVPVRSFLEQYSQFLRRYIVATPSDVDAVAFRLHVEHREALDHIRSVYNSPSGYGWDIIDEAMAALEPHIRPDYHTLQYHRFFAVCLDEVAELNEGPGFTDSKRIVLFQVDRDGAKRQLRLWIGLGAATVRNRVFGVAQNDDLPSLKSNRNKPLQGFDYVYEKTLLTDSDLLDREKARTVARQAVEEFFAHDFWPLVNGIRVEFGLEPVSPEAT